MFPDYLSVSYDYDLTYFNWYNNTFHKVNLIEIGLNKLFFF